MRNFSRIIFWCALLWSSTAFPHALPLPASSGPTIAQKISVPGIPNMGKVSNALFRGAQPRLASFEKLQELGVTTIVDLRSESHGRERERVRVESLGMHFITIPVGSFSTPTSAQLAEFFTLLRQAPLQKVFVHCQFGADRTGVFVAAYRIAFEHWSSDEALSEMLDFGFHRHWHPSMAAFVRSLPLGLRSDAMLKSALGN
jgi:protein-tyrosine phosphatase